MLNKQQISIARDLYRRSLRLEKITNGNTIVFDHDQHAAWFQAVKDEGELARVASDDWSRFCALAGAIETGAQG